MRLIGFLLVFILLSVAWGAPRVAFYVSPTGNDHNPGSAVAPFASLARARDAVRAIHHTKELPAGGVVVYVTGGRYALTQPLVFGPEDSGEPGAPVRYRAKPGEHPVFTGGFRITGWRPRGNNLWSAAVPPGNDGWQVRRLFVNDRQATCVRLPRAGYFTGIHSDDGKTLRFPANGFPAGNIGQGHLTIFVEWTTTHQPLERGTIEGTTITFPDGVIQLIDKSWAAHVKRNIPNMPYFFENLPGIPLQPGEWRWDNATRALYYAARPGENPLRARIEAPRQQTLLQVIGLPDRPVHDLEFEGLTFAHSDFQTPASGFMPLQAAMTGDPDNLSIAKPMPAAISCQYVQRCRFEGCLLDHPGAVGISLERGSRECVINGCAIAGAGGNGLQVGVLDPFPTPEQMVADNTISNNCIHDCGQLARGAVGIWNGITQNSTIVNNELYNLPYSAISVGWDWSHRVTAARGNRVMRNHIHDVVLLLADGGGIYTLGNQPGSEMTGNLIHDIARNYGVGANNGIFQDNGSEGWRIEGNMVYRIAGAPLRSNSTDPHAPQGKNYYGILPKSPEFPQALAEQAGLEPAWRYLRTVLATAPWESEAPAEPRTRNP